MSEFDVLFYIIALGLTLSGIGVVMSSNPIYSALFLVISMLGTAGIFFNLGATFLAGVQIIVYAGAVMVLFVMVLMLFDIKSEVAAFSRGRLSGATKLLTAGVLCGMIVGTILISSGGLPGAAQSAAEATDATAEVRPPANDTDETKALSRLLFTKYLFQFEVIGLLLLVVPIGAVALSRSPGGTHARNK